MGKILFIPSAGYAHITRTLELARGISDCYDVTVSIPERFIFLAKNIGLKYVILEFSKPNYKALETGQKFTQKEELQNKIILCEKLIDEIKPDIVVTSFGGLHYILKRKKIPHIAIMEACLTPFSKIKTFLTLEFLLKRIMPKIDLNGYIPNIILGIKLANIDKFLKKVLEPINDIMRDENLPPIKNLTDYLGGDFTVIPDLPSLLPCGDLPDNFKYIGPLVWTGVPGETDETVKIYRNDPLIYMSMGSSGRDSYFEKLVDILFRSKHQVVISCGDVSDFKKLNEKYKREKFYLKKFISGLYVLNNSNNVVVICHGGLGTVYQAIIGNAKGIICMPSHPEHTLVADRMDEIGIGKKIFPNQIKNVIKYSEIFFDSPRNSQLTKMNEESSKFEVTRANTLKTIIETLLQK
jgi:UDP:flavonoid glycosyltransferase YjiC (YdhE family)